MGLTLIFLRFFHLLPPEIGFCLQLYPFWLSLFSTTSPASPRLGQTSSFPCSFPLVLVPRWKQLVYGAASTSAPMGAFHAFSSLKQTALKLVPSNSSHGCCTPQTAPLAFLPFPSSSPLALCPQAGSSAGCPWCGGGRAGAVPGCRGGSSWSRLHWSVPAAAHRTRSAAFPRPAELVLVVPETLLLHASDLEISLSPCSWGLASLHKMRQSP